MAANARAVTIEGMRALAAIALLLTLAAPGLAAEGTVERTLDRAGAARTYRLHLPRGERPARPIPLVISIHGLGASARIQEAVTGLDELSDEKGFAVAYPEGRLRMWRVGERDSAGDVSFLSALIDALIAEGTADPRRVYVCGISNGAYMTNRLACAIPEKIAAIAPIAGTFPVEAANRARSGPAMPVCYFHGVADAVVGYDGVDTFTRRAGSMPAEAYVALWISRDGCGEKAKVEALPDLAKDGTTVERRTHAAGAAGAEVVFYRIVGGGHTWPGGSLQPEWLLGKTTRNLDASRVMWDFFARFTREPEPVIR